MLEIELQDSIKTYKNIFSSRWGLYDSGFLDLQTMQAIHLTTKENAYNIESWMTYIRNEISTQHTYTDLTEAKDFVKKLYSKQALKAWLNRTDSLSSEELASLAKKALVEALNHDVLLNKLLMAIPEKRLQAIKTAVKAYSRSFDSVETYTRLINLKHIAIILTNITQEERMELLTYKVSYGKTLSHFTTLYDSCFTLEQLLRYYSEENWLPILQQQSSNGETPLDQLVAQPAQFQALLRNPAVTKLNLLSLYRGKDGNTLGHIIAHSKFPRFLFELLKTHKNSTNLLLQRNDQGCTVLDYLSVQPELQASILAELMQNIEFIDSYEGKDNSSFFHLLLSSSKPELLLNYLENVNMRGKQYVLSLTDAMQNTLLHRCARLENIDLFKQLLAMLPAAMQGAALLAENKFGNHVYHELAQSGHFEYVLQLLHAHNSSATITELLLAENNSADILLNMLASTGSASAMLELFDTYLQEHTDLLFKRYLPDSESFLIQMAAKCDLAAAAQLISLLERIPVITELEQLFKACDHCLQLIRLTPQTSNPIFRLFSQAPNQELANRMATLLLKHLFIKIDELTQAEDYRQVVQLLNLAKTSTIFNTKDYSFVLAAQCQLKDKQDEIKALIFHSPTAQPGR